MMILEVPGNSWANSAFRFTVEVSLVCKKGSASTILVKMRESFLRLRSTPY